MTSLATYRPSGRLALHTIPIGLATGCLGGLGLGWIYQHFVELNPLIYFNLFATLILGVGVGLFARAGLVRARCRNRVVALMVGSLCALFTQAATFHLSYQRVTADIAASEEVAVADVREVLGLSEFLQARAEAGWSLRLRGQELDVSGLFAYGFWLLEALLLCFAAGGVASIAAGRPFCEACSTWARNEDLGKVQEVDVVTLREAIAGGDIEAIVASPEWRSDEGRTVSYSVRCCPTCDEEGYLTIAEHWTSVDKRGKPVDRVTALVEHAVVSNQQLESLRSRVAGVLAPA